MFSFLTDVLNCNTDARYKLSVRNLKEFLVISIIITCSMYVHVVVLKYLQHLSDLSFIVPHHIYIGI